jgi:hypothetical protein
MANRFKREGSGFFTKTLPRFGKAIDSALLGQNPLAVNRFRKEPNTQIPMLFGNLLRRVFDLNGRVLPTPCVDSIRTLRQICYLFYKYELPYDRKLEQSSIDKFVETEKDVREDVKFLGDCYHVDRNANHPRSAQDYTWAQEAIAHLNRARIEVHNLFAGLDLSCIVPRHGPGVVSTMEKYAEKYVFKRINPRAQEVFPFDKHMFLNESHLCDELFKVEQANVTESSAKVTLVPKDSRGPRIISCEPLENQWLQQGIMRAMVSWIERHPLTRDSVRFTDQEPNRMAALAGSYHGELATLDLKEASDRVSCWLVEQLFPEPILTALMSTRSLHTVLPDGTRLKLAKFAPMGSACCFPVLATCVWALLRSGKSGSDGRTVLVYGDDVIVETAYADTAIEELETFGLHVNRDKSCTSGLFRESCGMDAYNGEDVTPVRLRTVWSSAPRAEHYASWIAYANSMYARGYQSAATYVAERMQAVYGPIPQAEEYGQARVSKRDGFVTLIQPEPIRIPMFTFDTLLNPMILERVNAGRQAVDVRVRIIAPQKYKVKNQSGWVSLMRYFTERCVARDDSLLDRFLCFMEGIAQKCKKSTTDIVNCVNGEVATENELAALADEELVSDGWFAHVATLSSMTGIAIPVVHECLRAYFMRSCSIQEQVLRDFVPKNELDTYDIPKRVKLRWAWRPKETLGGGAYRPTNRVPYTS